MRLFLGVEIPEDAVRKIREAVQRLKQDYPEFLWVPEENYHITVFFFGERSENKLPDMIGGVEQVLYDIAPVELSTFGLGIFVRKDINIHIKLNRSRDLEIIHDRIISVIGSQIPQKHNKYIPHVTISKYKLPSKQQYFLLKKKIEKTSIDIEFRLEKLNIYQSIVQNSSHHYHILHTFHLQST